MTSAVQQTNELLELLDNINPPRVTWWSTMVFAFLVPMFALLFLQVLTTLPCCAKSGPGAALCCKGKIQRAVQRVIRKILGWKWACCCHKWFSDFGLEDGFPAM
jgi:hypothetical protein